MAAYMFIQLYTLYIIIVKLASYLLTTPFIVEKICYFLSCVLILLWARPSLEGSYLRQGFQLSSLCPYLQQIGPLSYVIQYCDIIVLIICFYLFIYLHLSILLILFIIIIFVVELIYSITRRLSVCCPSGCPSDVQPPHYTLYSNSYHHSKVYLLSSLNPAFYQNLRFFFVKKLFLFLIPHGVGQLQCQNVL